jgi:hypothetical protein
MRPVLLALLAALAVAPAAHAEPRFRDLGPSVAGPYTDGHRWAAWMPVRGRLTLFDTANGRAWTQPVAPWCRLHAVGAGMLLFACGTPFGIGGSHWHLSRYLDLATGRVVEDPADPHRQPSLDAPGLLVRMCSPLQRPHADIEDELVDYPFISVDYEPPWALLPIYARKPGDPTVWLAHCGRTRMRGICRGICEASLSAGVVTWSDEKGVGALVIASGRRLRWRGPAGAVMHTANRIFVVRWRTAATRALMARLPR